MSEEKIDIEKRLLDYNKLINRSYLGLLERKFGGNKISENDFKEFPISFFNILKIYVNITSIDEYSEENKQQISNRLLDIKSLFFFLNSPRNPFYIDTFEIIGNGELENGDERHLLWLQSTHYKVYIISSIYEKLIDLCELIYLKKITDTKTDKIGKKLKILWEIPEFDIVDKKENELLTEFRQGIRRGEIHGISSVMRQLFQNELNNLDTEKEIVNNIIKRLSQKFNIGIC
jgi:hypothetical protein